MRLLSHFLTLLAKFRAPWIQIFPPYLYSLISSFIISFNKYLLNIFNVPNTVLGTLDIICLQEIHHSHGDYTPSKQVSKIVRNSHACLEDKREMGQNDWGVGAQHLEWFGKTLNKPLDYLPEPGIY